VADTDADGLPDKLEEVSGLKLPNGTPFPDLHAMQATKEHKDVFVEIGALNAGAGTFYGPVEDETGHSHLPTPGVIKLLGDAYKAAPILNLDGFTGIRLHVDAGPGYPASDADEYIVRNGARGGELINEVGCEDTGR
jgi:hypothetical protein